MIEQRFISVISNKTAKAGGRRIPEAVIERDYCLAWFLMGLARFSIKDKLVFKGGAALRRCYFKDYRFSEDLDFTLLGALSLEAVLDEFKKVFVYVKDEIGISFGVARLEPSSINTHTFYLTYEGPLPGRAKEVKTDITFKEILLRPVAQKTIIKSYAEYSDFDPKAKVAVYSLEEVVIEKICALFSPHRNEPRDLYDVWYIPNKVSMDLGSLVDDVYAKARFKGIDFKEQLNQFGKKESRLKKLWSQRLEFQMTFLPPFDAVYRDVRRVFRQVGLNP
ncbi:MAG: nucleotidyl transferase AbiEii/AbiGii toxin family protein [Deltaproteobacteria bacterium]|nr:nucleotidyl transferase AbiEii/AbiGii toxin family protein [Deltaproteobacteria bacterium]